MELYVIRHGETVFNINKIIQGQSESELTDQGISQAKKIAERLKDFSFDKAYSSDLLRAKQTAKEVMEYHLNTPIEYSKDLREMSFGNLEGKPVTHLAEQFKKYGPFDRFTSVDTCETHAEMFTRINNFFVKLIKDYICELYSNKVDVIKANSIEESNGSILNTMYKNCELTIKSTPELKKKILVVTHGGWISNFLNVILWMRIGKILNEYSSRNTSLYIFRVYCRECNGVCSLIPQSECQSQSKDEDKAEDKPIETNTITMTSNQCNHSIEISIDLLNDISHLS